MSINSIRVIPKKAERVQSKPKDDLLHATEIYQNLYVLSLMQFRKLERTSETVRLQENLGYGVTVLSEQSATRDLREYLAGEWMDRAYRAEDIAVSGIPSPRDYPRLRNRGKDFRDGINRLQTIINLTQSGQHKDELAKALKLLRPSSTFSLRVHLNCVLRRPVE